MRRFLIALAVLVWPSVGTAQPEAADVLAQRQTDLTALAEHLGALHRLHQVCHPEEQPDLFRRRMMSLVRLEVPKGSTRLQMIDAFNTGYRDATLRHAICGREARADYAGEAEKALALTEQLYSPFRPLDVSQASP